MDGPPHTTNTMAVSERQRRRMCVLLASLCASVAHAQYPVRPVKIIVGLTAGGGVDVVSRIIAQKLGDSTGQSFVVDNRTGAGGNIAFELAAKSEPDGYTLLNSSPGIVTNPTLYAKVNYKIDDFAAVSLIGKAPLVFARASRTNDIRSINALSSSNNARTFMAASNCALRSASLNFAR